MHWQVRTCDEWLVFLDPDEEIIYGEIDTGVANLIAEGEASIDPAYSRVYANDTTVQQYTDFFVAFKVPLPVLGGCIILIEIPDDFTVKAGDVSQVNGWGIFGGITDLIAQIDETARTIKIVDQCRPYSGANI